MQWLHKQRKILGKKEFYVSLLEKTFILNQETTLTSLIAPFKLFP